MQKAIPRDLVLAAARKHFDVTGSFEHYPGIVTLHGLARLAHPGADEEALVLAREHLLPFARGERKFACNFPNYQCGGNAAAWLLFQGKLPEAAESVHHFAEVTMNNSSRDAEGIFCHPKYPGNDRIFIDVAFAVSPFLLFAGLALQNDGYVAEAWNQTRRMVDIFRDPAVGLLHQCRGFRGPGLLSEDHWARGNGWGAYALAELAMHLPPGAEQASAAAMLRDLLTACLQVQDAKHRLWRQEMIGQSGYIETSGSALILYALGIALELKLFDDATRPAYEDGLRALLGYITDDMDVFHVCSGCLNPGKGTVLDYLARQPTRNDPHGYGPIALAMGQAHRLGFSSLVILDPARR